MSSPDRKSKTYSRDTAGLRDFLFDELEDYRLGHVTPHEAISVASLAERVLDTMEMEMKAEAFRLNMAERRLEHRERRIAALTELRRGKETIEGEVLDGETPVPPMRQ